jgi:hypothetical protein
MVSVRRLSDFFLFTFMRSIMVTNEEDGRRLYGHHSEMSGRRLYGHSYD